MRTLGSHECASARECANSGQRTRRMIVCASARARICSAHSAYTSRRAGEVKRRCNFGSGYSDSTDALTRDWRESRFACALDPGQGWERA